MSSSKKKKRKNVPGASHNRGIYLAKEHTASCFMSLVLEVQTTTAVRCSYTPAKTTKRSTNGTKCDRERGPASSPRHRRLRSERAVLCTEVLRPSNCPSLRQPKPTPAPQPQLLGCVTRSNIQDRQNSEKEPTACTQWHACHLQIQGWPEETRQKAQRLVSISCGPEARSDPVRLGVRPRRWGPWDGRLVGQGAHALCLVGEIRPAGPFWPLPFYCEIKFTWDMLRCITGD